jgi:hypothetical protein
MTAELDSAGALATAALVASELEDETGKSSPAAAAPLRSATSPASAVPAASAAAIHAYAKCANCGTDLVGAYCHSCGQSSHVHRSLLHIGEELLHGILHFDTRSWRTLPLLALRPGLLTRRYIDGQRSRYVSPLALFLFSVFLMFFTYSFVGDSDAEDKVSGAQQAQAAREQIANVTDDVRERVNALTRDLAAATTPAETAAIGARLANAQKELQTTTAALSAISSAIPAATAGSTDAPNAGDQGAGSLSSAIDRIFSAKEMDARYPRTTRIVRHAVDNPELTAYKIKSSAYKLAFMLVPISMPFLWLLFFWRRDIKFYDHAIFMLYSLSFMSLWFALMTVLSFSSSTSWLIVPAVLYVPVHIFLQVKETYALSGWGATWRTFALMFAGTIIFLMFVTMIFAITLG